MSATIPLAEAKNKLSELIERVTRGEEFTITRHDQPVARLAPVQRKTKADIFQKISEFQKLREKNILNPPGTKEKLTFRDLVNEGRK